MQLFQKTFRGLVVAFLALAVLTLGPKPGFAFMNGQFNLIKIAVCESITQNDEDFLVVVDANTGGTLVLADVLTVLAVLPLCHPGNQFFAFFENGAVTNVAVVPGL
ncbi:MAG TPA: hypothetical protein VGU20_32655 [Stellaceae bacterium]|nr:hypothetical protein [Stellaceae bacterium]